MASDGRRGEPLPSPARPPAEWQRRNPRCRVCHMSPRRGRSLSRRTSALGLARRGSPPRPPALPRPSSPSLAPPALPRPSLPPRRQGVRHCRPRASRLLVLISGHMTDALLVDASRPRGARGLLAFLCIEAPTHPQDPTRRLQKDLAGRGFRGRRPRLRLRATALAALSWPALGREGHGRRFRDVLLCARSPTPVCSRHVWDTSMGADGGRGCRVGGPGRERPTSRRAAAVPALGRAALLASRPEPPARRSSGRETARRALPPPRGERVLPGGLSGAPLGLCHSLALGPGCATT